MTDNHTDRLRHRAECYAEALNAAENEAADAQVEKLLTAVILAVDYQSHYAHGRGDGSQRYDGLVSALIDSVGDHLSSAAAERIARAATTTRAPR